MSMTDRTPLRWPIWSGLAIAAAVALRLVLMVRLPLADNTESRYGAIAWEMSRSGDWVTPWTFVDGVRVPFLAKPPLNFWLSSLSYRLCGASAWSARLPNFLLGLAIVAATAAFAGGLWGRRVAGLSGVILITSAAFFGLFGACILDMPLTAATTAAMIAMARLAAGGPRRYAWGLAFFLALAVGLLAKGPIMPALVALTLGLWIALTGRWRLIVELPWLSGLALCCLVAGPWYVLAERASPGFLHYFLVHEHFLRYLQHDYGDLYGAGRAQPYGTSWLMLLGSLLPWTILAIAALAQVFAGKIRLWCCAAIRGWPMCSCGDSCRRCFSPSPGSCCSRTCCRGCRAWPSQRPWG